LCNFDSETKDDRVRCVVGFAIWRGLEGRQATIIEGLFRLADAPGNAVATILAQLAEMQCSQMIDRATLNARPIQQRSATGRF
jgi:hypothetical protein